MGQIFPVRDLAKYGLNVDVDPYNLPVEAWSRAVNVRFQNQKVSRGPVWRAVSQSLANDAPRFVVGHTFNTGTDAIYLGYMDGKVTKFSAGTETDATLSGYSPSSVEATWTTTNLANVLYVNRSDRTPWYLRAGDSLFQDLGAASWPSGWTAQIIRSCSGALCAFNITQSGTSFPTMVATSNFPTSGTVPSTFEVTLGGVPTDATQNILPEFTGPIIDAQTLGNVLYIYGENEVWSMTMVGGTNVWDYAQVFDGRGAINTNCVVEVNGMHYIFGTDDVWVHNGITPQSICSDRVREFIYGSLNAQFASRCQVFHNRPLQEIMFMFRSGDELVKYPNSTDGLNRSATYDYVRDRWTLDDLPLVYFAGRANLDNSLEYATVTSTYATIGGTYATLDDSFRKASIFVGDVDSSDSIQKSLYAFDPSGPLSQVTAPIDANASQPAFLARDGIDLDTVGVDLKGYKICQSIYPQGRLSSSAQPLDFTFGAADFFNETPTFTPAQSWDGNSFYKLDFGVAGRYLSMTVEFDDVNFFSLTGLDLDLDVLGER